MTAAIIAAERLGLMPVRGAALGADVTYRQTESWIRAGLVTAVEIRDERTAPRHPDSASGTPSFLTADECAHLTLMGRLVLAGLPPRVAARCARELAWGSAHLAPGFLITQMHIEEIA